MRGNYYDRGMMFCIVLDIKQAYRKLKGKEKIHIEREREISSGAHSVPYFVLRTTSESSPITLQFSEQQLVSVSYTLIVGMSN